MGLLALMVIMCYVPIEIGGVCIYIRNHVNYVARPDLVLADLEVVCLEIYQVNAQSFVISNIYTIINHHVKDD